MLSPGRTLTGRQETLFGRTVTPQERLRQHHRALTKAQRELDRERCKLEQSEKKLITDIRKSAKSGQIVRSPALPLHYPAKWANPGRRAQNACKVMAKDLVRTRRYVQKFYQMRTQLQAVALRIQTLRSNQQMADAMRGATRVSCRTHNTPRIIADYTWPTTTGNGVHEPRTQPTWHSENYERFREGELYDGHEGGNDGGDHG